MAFVGSANATMAAMTLNEEILVQVPDDGAIEDYAERVWEAAVQLRRLGERLEAKSLVGFFRTGALYFKPTTSLQTTLNPFTELLASLSDSERKKLGSVSLPHSDQEAGIGAFNLRKAAGLADTARDSEDREIARANIKPYAVETCLGYWVPRAVHGEFQAALEKVRKNKRARLLKLRVTLESVGTKTLTMRYAEYVAAAHRFLVGTGVSFSQFVASSRRNPFDTAQLASFLKRVLARLQDDDYLKRLYSPFVRGAMPELWDDPLAYSDFETSFFEYLEYVAQRPGKKSHVPARIIERSGLRAVTAPHAATIKSSLENLLKSAHWGEDDWRRTAVGSRRRNSGG